MFDRVTLGFATLSESQEPEGKICKLGHVAHETWIHPLNGQRMPRRFLRVSGRALPKEEWGDYCEECVARANAMAEQSKGIFSGYTPGTNYPSA